MNITIFINQSQSRALHCFRGFIVQFLMKSINYFEHPKTCIFGLYDIPNENIEIFLAPHTSDESFCDTVEHECLHHCLEQIDKSYNTEYNVEFIQRYL